jgi:uncharacterized iron-regulated membrane protein
MKPSARKALFQVHLWAGLIAGSFLALVSLTGVVLAYQPEIDVWLHRDLLCVEPGEQRLPLDVILATGREALGHEPTLLTVEGKADRSVVVEYRTGSEYRAVYVNQYNGRLLGEQDILRTFLFQTEAFHRHLFLGEPGYLLMGLMSAICVVLVVTGLWLWWPKNWKKLKAGLTFHANAKGRAWWLGLHNVIGLYSAIVVVILGFSAVVLVVTPRLIPQWSAFTSVLAPRAAAPRTGSGLERGWAEALRRTPNFAWATIALPPPASEAAIRITTVAADAPQYYARSQLYVDPRDGTVLRYEPYAAERGGRKFYSWNKSLHIGLVARPIGQLLAFLGGVALIGLVLTGTWLYVRRKLSRQITRALAADGPGI